MALNSVAMLCVLFTRTYWPLVAVAIGQRSGGDLRREGTCGSRRERQAREGGSGRGFHYRVWHPVAQVNETPFFGEPECRNQKST